MSRRQRPYRLYFRLWGRWYIRSGWRIAYSQTETNNVVAVSDATSEYFFRRRLWFLSKEW